MKLIDFKDLNERDQIKVVLKYSTRIGKRYEGIYRFVLYQVDSFYVELKYYKNTQAIHGMKSLASTSKLLDKYLTGIDLSSLYI
jgi:hypothetical protein